MKVYLVNQTQEDELRIDCYMDKTIYVCSTKKRVMKYCQELNKEYGRGCEFDKDWNFVEVLDDYDYHYYDWEAVEVDEPLA